ncbi:MAG: hypothetical protein K1X92_14965 [Bacteroidia bacterium]|nr:hypothetical protein [Bacteroidia bacterium]
MYFRSLFSIFLFHTLLLCYAFGGNPKSVFLYVKPLGKEFTAISNPEKIYVPLVAGDSYIIKIQSDSITEIKCRFPNLESESRVPDPSVFETDVTIPAGTERGTTYYINVYRQGSSVVTLNFEIVKRGKISAIYYTEPEIAKQKKGIDLLKPNTVYGLMLQGENMNVARFNISRFPKLIPGTFLSLYSQKTEPGKGLLLKVRTGTGEKGLSTSLLYFLNKETITDMNADIVVPWILYTFGNGETFSSGLPVDYSKHSSDLTLIQLE